MLSGEIEMPMGKPSIIPKTASGSSAADHENKGESMSDGMRTERVVLEITTDANRRPASEWYWNALLTGTKSSVRVVPESEGVSWKQVCDEGERISREEGYKILTAEIEALHAERDALAARVESAEERCDELRSMLKTVSDESNEFMRDAQESKARVAELEVTVKESLTVAAPAAEPVAWGVEINGHTQACYFTKYWADRLAEEENGTVVPICFSPPQPRGWLTGEEVWALRVAADNIPGMEDADGEPLDELEIVFRKLLARNSPPEVVLPASVHKDILAALAAAGVKVKSQS
jgi:hypothetical protein